jgi:hypothetical protein
LLRLISYCIRAIHANPFVNHFIGKQDLRKINQIRIIETGEIVPAGHTLQTTTSTHLPHLSTLKIISVFAAELCVAKHKLWQL